MYTNTSMTTPAQKRVRNSGGALIIALSRGIQAKTHRQAAIDKTQDTISRYRSASEYSINDMRTTGKRNNCAPATLLRKCDMATH